MHKVLVFTYYWPPSGGPAVQRWLSLSQLLPEFGIEPIIITVDPASASYVLLDQSLEKRVPAGLAVHKTKSFEILTLYQRLVGKDKLPTAGFANESEPGLLQKAMRWIRGNCFFPDPRKGWNRYALQKAREVIKAQDIKAVITAGPPQSTHLIGEQLQKEFNLFWLCDFHDAWTNVWYYDELKKTNWAKNIDLRTEKRVLEKADHIITVGNQIKADFSQKLGNDTKIRIHSMGYDDDQFDVRPEVPKDVFTITYTGTMADNYEPEALFEALSQLRKQHTDFLCNVQLVGLISEGIKKKVEELGIADMVELKGYMPHAEAIDCLKQSCMLLLVSPNTPQAKMIIPGKIYEYLATGIPILNLATQDTETARIISECEGGATFSRSNIDEIKDYLWNYFLIWKKNPEDILSTSMAYKKYSRRREAEELAGSLKAQFD